MHPPNLTTTNTVPNRSSSSPDTSDVASSTPIAVKKEFRQESIPSEKPRGGQACLECRLAKVKCLPSDELENCQRCHRFNFECLFVQHKRGRKPKSKLQGRDLTLLAEAASATNAAPVPRPEASIARKPSIVTHSANPSAASPKTPAKSPSVRWSAAADGIFAALSNRSDSSALAYQGAYKSIDMGTDGVESPFSAFFSKKQPASAHNVGRDALDPENLYGVDVRRMTAAMQQAMRSLDRRRGAPYTLVTNNEISTVQGDQDDGDSQVGTPLTPAAATTTADTNAVNESFELIAEQPLTLRIMLKPFEVSEQPDYGTPSTMLEQFNPLAAQRAQQQPDDPITEGILTEPAARALFDHYMRCCNIISGVFDPQLHTHDFVRKRSSFLYTVIMYVASRYSRRPTAHHLIVREERHQPVDPAEWDITYADPDNDRSSEAADEYARQVRCRIHQQARKHVAKAFVDGDRSVLCCQAFFVMASWKPLDDGLSVIQVGFAFRLAMDIQLHAEMPNCVKPTDSNLDQAGLQRYEAVQRRFRNRQRTFLMLFVQDKSQQISNKITTHSISADNVLIRRCQTWWKQEGAIPTDGFVCASADIRRIQAKYVDLYDRIEALTSATSDGPSVMMPAFLADLDEWNARWHEALGLREDTCEDIDDKRRHLDEAAYQRKCQRLSLKMWKDNIKTYVSSLVLKSSLRQAAMAAHQEMVRNHNSRSATRGTDDRAETSSTKSQLGLEPGVVNLMAMPAFWPCVEGARGVLEAICAFPEKFLLASPDSTVMQTTHAAVLLCSLATVRSHPPLGPGYLKSNIQLIDQTIAAFRKASITRDDTVLHIANYLDSLLRPKNAPPSRSRPAAGQTNAEDAQAGGTSSTSGGTGARGRTQSNTQGQQHQAVADILSNGAAGANGGSAANGAQGLNGFSQFTNFTLLSQNTDLFYSGGANQNNALQSNGRWTNGSNVAASNTTNPNLFLHGDVADGLQRDGLDAMAAAASQSMPNMVGESGAASSLDMDGIGWPSAMDANSATQPWNNLVFGANNGTNSNATTVAQNQTPAAANNNTNDADETLRMLLRFLDG